MRIFLDGYNFMIKDITKEDVRSLLRMIKSACLGERRNFNHLKEQIEDLAKKDLL